MTAPAAPTHHAPRRPHPQTPCAPPQNCHRRRPPARRSSASSAAPACCGCSNSPYRPAPAARCCCSPSPTPAVTHNHSRAAAQRSSARRCARRMMRRCCQAAQLFSGTPNTAKSASVRTRKPTLAWQRQQQRTTHRAARIHKHRVATGGGHLHDGRQCARAQLLRRVSIVRIAQPQLPVRVAARRPRLRTQSQQSSSTTLISTQMRKAGEAHSSCKAAQLPACEAHTAKSASVRTRRRTLA